MLGTQYTYFSAIQYSNAAIATVLTYFGPTLVLIFMCLKERRKPLKYEIVSILLSSFGVFLLATHGDVTSLQISFKALVWGLLSALSVVIYTVQPEKLLKIWTSNSSCLGYDNWWNTYYICNKALEY